jgi:hypothetical protein
VNDLDELDEDEDDGGDDGDPQRIPGSKRLCPECSEPMEPDAVLCVECGYHVRLKRRIRTEMS